MTFEEFDEKWCAICITDSNIKECEADLLSVPIEIEKHSYEYYYLMELSFWGNNVARELLERVDSKTNTMTQSASVQPA